MTDCEMRIEIENHCNRVESCSKCELYLIDDCYSEDLTTEELKTRYEMIRKGKNMETIKDSGERTEFATGAVRDIKNGVGRCDLLPLDVVAGLMSNDDIVHILGSISRFMNTGEVKYLSESVLCFSDYVGLTIPQLMLEVSKHYQQGAEKYGERNWEKGILLHSYIDSGVRHFLKHIDGQTDERHDRAFVWNILGAIWTMEHRPQMIDIPFELLGDKGE